MAAYELRAKARDTLLTIMDELTNALSETVTDFYLVPGISKVKRNTDALERSKYAVQILTIACTYRLPELEGIL